MVNFQFFQKQPTQNLGEGSRKIFVLFCTYYIFASYLSPSSGIIRQYSPEYFALILPGWAFVWMQRRFIFQVNNWFAVLWWLFVLSTMLVSIFQGSASLAYNGLYLGLVALAIMNSGGYLRTEELNVIFLATIAGSIVVYYLGISDYSFIPLWLTQDCHQSLGFRVSLFRVLSESAALSFFVILWNIFFPPAWPRLIRWIIISLAVYFLIFSGIRTLIISVLIVSPLLIFTIFSGVRLRVRLLAATLIPIFIITIISIFILAPKIDYGIKNILLSYVFRVDSCSAISVISDKQNSISHNVNSVATENILERTLNDQGIPTSWLLGTINRQCASAYQFRMFLDNPLVGSLSTHTSARSKIDIPGCTKDALERYCDACVLTTYWLSRGGVSGIILIVIYIFILIMAIRRRSIFGVTALVSFGLFMQGWGVMFVPYNFIYFMLMSLFPIIFNGSKTSVAWAVKK